MHILGHKMAMVMAMVESEGDKDGVREFMLLLVLEQQAILRACERWPKPVQLIRTHPRFRTEDLRLTGQDNNIDTDLA